MRQMGNSSQSENVKRKMFFY